MYLVKRIWILTIISQEIERMKINFYVFVVACFAKLRKLYIFKKYFSRCHAFLTNAIIFLILHKPHIWCIAVNQSASNFRTSQLCVSHHVTQLLMPTIWFALDLAGRVQGLSVNPKNSLSLGIELRTVVPLGLAGGGGISEAGLLLACMHTLTHTCSYAHVQIHNCFVFFIVEFLPH